MGRRSTAPPQTWDQSILRDGVWIDATPQPGKTYTRDTWPPRRRGRGESLISPRRIEAKLRAIEVVEMRLGEHQTWEQIAAALGFKDASGAYRAYKRTMDRLNWDESRRVHLRRERFKEQYGLTDEDIGVLRELEE